MNGMTEFSAGCLQPARPVIAGTAMAVPCWGGVRSVRGPRGLQGEDPAHDGGEQDMQISGL